jgi:hypothetical protein
MSGGACGIHASLFYCFWYSVCFGYSQLLLRTTIGKTMRVMWSKSHSAVNKTGNHNQTVIRTAFHIMVILSPNHYTRSR